MRIIVDQDFIEEAVEKLILDQVNIPDEMHIDIDLKATRGDTGYQAIIDITSSDKTKTEAEVREAVQPTPEARSEGLGIVDKITAAKAESTAPKRRGRPPGSKNKTKDNEALVEAADNAVALNEPVTTTIEGNNELFNDTTVEAPQEEAAEVASQVEPIEEEAPAPAATVTEADVSSQASDELVEQVSEPEPNSEEALAAEAAATEPAEEEAEELGEPTPPPAPRQSLFANLKKPQN